MFSRWTTHFLTSCLVALVLVTAGGATGVQAADLSSKLFEFQLRRAKEGDIKSQLEIARRYEAGRGVAQNLEQAYFWYRRAAEQGVAEAQFRIGQMFAEGRGVARDPAAARDWLGKAAAQGHGAADQALAAMAAAERAARARAERQAREEAERKARAEREARERAARERAERERQAREQAAREQAERARAEQERQAREARERAEREARERQALSVARTMEMLRAGDWAVGGVPVEFLPSARTSCVRQGAARLLCFTGERNVSLGGKHVRYQVKSEILVEDGGRVKVQYRYQVLKLRGAGKSLPPHDQPVAPALEPGWQAPQDMDCQLQLPASLDCAGGDGRHYALNR